MCPHSTMNTAEAIQRLRQVIRRQHKALSIEHCYVFWLRRYMAALLQMPEGLSSETKLEQFLTYLACHDNDSASTQNQAFNAVLFFYKEVLGQTIQNVNSLRAKRLVQVLTKLVPLAQQSHPGFPPDFERRYTALKVLRSLDGGRRESTAALAQRRSGPRKLTDAGGEPSRCGVRTRRAPSNG